MSRTEVINSYGRCRLHPKFARRFCEILAGYPLVPTKRTPSDYVEQAEQLLAELTKVMLRSGGAAHHAPTLIGLDRRKDRGNAIDPQLYPLLIESLLQAVKECDPKWRSELEEGWRLMLAAWTGRLSSLRPRHRVSPSSERTVRHPLYRS